VGFHQEGGDCIKITVASQHHACGIPGLGHLCFGAAPVTLDTEHRAQPGPACSPATAAGVKPFQNRRLISSDHGAQDLKLGHKSCRRLLSSITDTATVADGTDTNTKIDRARRPQTSAPITPIGAATYLADPGRAADQ
jgi:hypothetical protein